MLATLADNPKHHAGMIKAGGVGAVVNALGGHAAEVDEARVSVGMVYEHLCKAVESEIKVIREAADEKAAKRKQDEERVRKRAPALQTPRTSSE